MPLLLRGRVGLVFLRLSRAIGRLAGLALATPVVLSGVQILFRPWEHLTWLRIWVPSLVVGVLLSLMLALAGAFVAHVRSTTDGVLRVDGSDIVVETAEGARRVPLASVLSGVVVPQARGARIELLLTTGDQLFAEVESLAEGERALRQLGLDAGKRRCAIPLIPRSASVLRRVGAVTLTLMTSLMVLGMATGGRHLTALSAAVWLGATTLGVTLAAFLTRQREITVGADGVLLRRLVGSRFLRFDEIRGVRAKGRQVTLELAGDQAVTVGRTASAETIALRVEEAIRARSESSDASAALGMLARAGRSMSEWRAALARLAQRTQDYRGVALSGDDLAAILENPASTEEHRIGAAMGLCELGGEEQKGRLRIAADACASEPMRVALAKLADGDVDEAALEEALAEVEVSPAEQKIR